MTNQIASVGPDDTTLLQAARTRRRSIIISICVALVTVLALWMLQASRAAASQGPIIGIGGKCLDNRNNVQVNSNAVQLWNCNGSAAQKWTVLDDGSIRTPGNRCLDVQYGGLKSETPVWLYACNGTGAQKWKVESGGQIVNPQSGLCLDDKWAQTNDGNPIWIYTCNSTPAQKWDARAALPTPDPVQTSYGRVFSVPGMISVEDYDRGGEGIAYHDTDAANKGNAVNPATTFRPQEGVDIYPTVDSGGGWQVGWSAAGEWLEYTVNVTQAGTYRLEARAASGATAGGRLDFATNMAYKTMVAVPRTGSYGTFQTLSSTEFTLAAGQQVFRITTVEGSFDLNWIQLVPASQTPAPAPNPTPNPAPQAVVPLGQSGAWSLAFRDEFDGSSLNAANWAAQEPWNTAPGYSPPDGTVNDGWCPIPLAANNDLVVVKDGTLKLNAVARPSNGKPIQACMITTRGKHDFGRGYFETRVKIPAGAGLWPSFWLLGNEQWPFGGEIDIFEFVNNGKDNGTPFFTVHYGGQCGEVNGHCQLQQGNPYPAKITDYTSRFMTIGLLRTATELKVYLDGKLLQSLNASQKNAQGVQISPVIFNSRMHIRFDLEVGGWAKNPSIGHQPGTYEIDYVRAWNAQ